MKKNLITTTVTLLVVVVQLFAQNGAKEFKIEGKLTGRFPDTAYLQYRSGGEAIRQQQVLKKGSFHFSGQLNEPTIVALKFVDKKGGKPVQQSFFVEGGDQVQVSGDLADVSSLRFTGAALQDDWRLYQQMTGKEKDFNKQIGLTYDFMAGHPESYISAYLLAMYSAMLPLDSTIEVYEALSSSVKETPVGQKLKDIVATRTASAPGKMAVGFSGADAEGNPLRLSDFKGKYLLLDFWASWCVPCRKSHPHLISLYHKYKVRNFDVVGIASDMGREAIWKEAIAKDGIGIWHHLLEREKTSGDAAEQQSITDSYGVGALPTKILIDPDGKIIGRFTGDGGSELDAQLLKIFN
ncbi:hypothetical protein PBAL39_14304 [Pedobacter sp. BAL39]|uniref:TlpA disulfide reductase family protein n=1 Tax=Pedobacter sp. BAL39 TaxID=391596 RepID=UPI000155AD65|nr:TlpA disulfide reductase family protein [Pedobacter sp. BAL39]EDM34736.1 hypothetical protein PBAL39_14304 [Pedobacter sp. BAL39]